MRIIGLDPSLTATGVSLLDTTDRSWDVTTLKRTRHVVAGDPRSEFDRIVAIVTELRAWLRDVSDDWAFAAADLIVMEGPAFSRTAGKTHERAGLWWAFYAAFVEACIPVLVVKPNVRAKYATGKGNAGKDAVILAAARYYPDAEITDNNQADAVVLAAIGARFKEDPVEGVRVGKARLDAMRTVAFIAS